ncbi:concanavalin A-like lectin/glucanase domain-containing protein [Amylocystis lapponica]|nr:concanavalin A-like lectin/glucanase domain-containing protein [Amylocystis lapponica]
MHATLSAVVLALPLAALGNLHQDGAFRRHHQDVAHARRTQYTLKDHYKADDFFGWNFFDQSDPTGGNVQYVSLKDAQNGGLAYVDSCDNSTVLAVDDKSSVASGGARKSVRISSPKTYNSGLVIGDFAAMPFGCGVWPAFWMVSANGTWPNGGEIDIIEGVNLNKNNQITLHSGPDCSLSSIEQTTSNVINKLCTSEQGNDAGCAFSLPNATSFGEGFNNAGGGVYAMLWDSTGMKFWFFSRPDVPADITNTNPDPTSWGIPVAAFPSSICDISSHFFDQTIVLDTTICGDWAGGAYSSSGCPGSCSDIVANATNFSDAKWRINSISVYQ